MGQSTTEERLTRRNLAPDQRGALQTHAPEALLLIPA